jgi:predicted exporter
LLVFGIGIDYGLFFSRQEPDVRMRQRTLHALSVCALSTVSVFAILSLSAVPVLQDIGITVWLGVLLSFVFALLLSQPWAAHNTVEENAVKENTTK